MTKPISPKEIAAAKARLFPAAVFEAFNELIAENFTNGRAEVYQKQIVARIKDKLLENTPFKYEYLNVEEAYREQGWNVQYDKPGYNESYDAYFIFKEK